MQKTIIIAGNMVVDTIKAIDSYPSKNMLSTISSVQKSVGGCVLNTSLDLRALDALLSLSAIGRVGNDADGAFLISTLNSHHINTDAVIVDKELPTSFTDVMTEPDGERTFFHCRGANSRLSFENFDLGKITADIFHIGYALLLDSLDADEEMFGTQMAKLLSKIQKKGIKTSLDVVSENSNRFKRIVTPSLKYCDYVIINETEAGLIAEINPRIDGVIKLDRLRLILNKFIKMGVKSKVVIHCPEVGVCIDSQTLAITVVPSLLLPDGYIKGAVGAGDAFCSGILYSIANGFDDKRSLEVASCVAAQNLSSPDSVGAAVSFEETMKLEKIYKRRII